MFVEKRDVGYRMVVAITNPVKVVAIDSTEDFYLSVLLTYRLFLFYAELTLWLERCVGIAELSFEGSFFIEYIDPLGFLPGRIGSRLRSDKDWKGITMGYTYTDHGRAAPFVPASMAYPKKKAKELKGMFDDVPLSLAQLAIAKALSWNDWFALDCAVKEGRTPSAPDEEVSEEERLRRWSTQFNAIHETLNLRLPDPEYVVAQLGLTCSSATAKKRRDDVGPWGAFQEPPEEIAPGIWCGECAKFECYRLSPERQAAVPAHWRLATDGWYMIEDHGWRVEMSFPEVFSDPVRNEAMDSLEADQPFLFELETGRVSRSLPEYLPSLAHRQALATVRPEAWFALSNFPAWSLRKGNMKNPVSVVSAVRGRDLLRLIASKGVWPEEGSIEVAWFAMDTSELQERCRAPVDWAQLKNAMAGCISGAQGYRHPPVCANPFKIHPFDAQELSFISCVTYDALVDDVSEGIPVPIQ